MQRIDGTFLYSPHDLINFMQCEFITWMDRRYLDDRSLRPDEDDESTKILQQKGIEHESAYLAALKETGKSVVSIDSGASALSDTLAAMREGYDIIYQAMLRHGSFGGISDFLYKREGASNLGDYHYEVFDTKLAKSSKPEFVIQLCCYADLLEQIQGKLPEVVGITLGTGEIDLFRTQDYYFYYKMLKRAFLSFLDKYDPQEIPDDIRVLPFSRWNTEAERLLKEQDALSQVANIRRLQIRRLKESDIRTMQQLAETDLHFVPKIGSDTFSTLKQQARLQIASRGLDKPKYEILTNTSPTERLGLALLPPADPGDVWFDMEGYPLVEGGLEYLFGASSADPSTCSADGPSTCSADGPSAPKGESIYPFIDFWAHNRDDEKLAFEQFIDWAFARWKKHPGMHIYHYASYEVSAMRRLMGRHGTREHEVDELLRNDVFVDLYQIVRHSLRVGEPSYSIKNIEHLYRRKRAGDVSTAVDSIVYYERWLVDPDGATWRQSKILNDIREYNRLDCESTLELTNWLRERQLEAGIKYIPKPCKSDEEEDKPSGNATARRNAELAKDLTAATLSNESLDEQSRQLSLLLADLLQFHERELKPTWWTLFDQLSMTQDELILDTACVGGLARTAKAAEDFSTKRANWRLYEYQFDPSQETKLTTNAKCCFSYDFNCKTEITAFDRDRGTLTIKLRAEAPEPQTPFGLIPYEIFPKKALQDALFSIVETYRANGSLPPAIADFLLRNAPRIKGKREGDPLITGAAEHDLELLDVILGMESTTLCMQGPPGSGKTTTASKVISELLRRGFRVGITSNSHKSIEHLLNKCALVATADGITVVGAKIGADSDQNPQVHPSIELFAEKKQVFPPEDFNLIGGTAYAFCFDLAVDAFDYLFVDEAGQMSIANLTAISRCARNIILIGDQMQLEQPVQGFHPGDSGMSTLEYYMRDLATIPPDRGIFLAVSHRMHPDVCALVSNSVYEGKLHSSDETRSRVLILPGSAGFQPAPTTSATSNRRITSPAGILFVPVDHDGNTQYSEEEAVVIKELIYELLECNWVDDGTQRRLTIDDILVVAPYNMQVRTIRDYIPDVKVGTVDKFQGQEGAVVILSMCSSDANSSPRGLNFLFNKNRLNVAISRAKTLAIVVASTRLAYSECTSLNQMAMSNFFCRIVEEGHQFADERNDASARRENHQPLSGGTLGKLL